MATKYYCDKCDGELSAKAQKAVSIVFKIEDGETKSFSVDLCEGCKRSVLKAADPKEWANVPRDVPEGRTR